MPSAPTINPLPQPTQRPLADVVIYDGDCQICTAQVKRLAKWDTRGNLAFLSLHDPEVAQCYPDLTHDELMKNMVVVDRRGRRHPGAAALRQIARRVPRFWWAVPLLSLPGTLPIWQWLYRQVADRRYRFNRHTCDGGTCHLHGKQ